eukprot:c40834_g1_i1 orf=168-374(+)
MTTYAQKGIGRCSHTVIPQKCVFSITFIYVYRAELCRHPHNPVSKYNIQVHHFDSLCGAITLQLVQLK